MASTPHALAHIEKLHAYTPGVQPTDSGWVKLNTNENPYPPSPRVREAILKEVGEEGATLRLYPNPRSDPLRAVVAKLHKVSAEQVCIGNGSDDILNLLVRAYCTTHAPAGFTFPSYSLYPVLVGIQDGAVQSIPFDRSMQLPLEAIAASKASAFFLTSPNAPTGVGFTTAQIEAAVSRFQGLFVVDEAYAPFADEDAVPLLSKYPNLVVVRTLSKAYALAGIRVGYALASKEVIGILDRVRDSYNVNRLSQAAAIGALSDPGYYHATIGKVKETRDYYNHAWGAGRGWFAYLSQSNFLFVEPKTSGGKSGPEVAKSAFDYLLSRKILVRYFPSHALTASFLRISVGTDDEMLAVHESLDAWLKAPNNA